MQLEKTPIHMMVLRGGVYASAVLLFLGPLTDTAGVCVSLAAAAIGLWLARAAAVSRLRWPAIVGGALAVFILALKIGDFLGGPASLPRLLGYRTVLGALEHLSFALAILALVFGFRTLASRVPALGMLEVAVLAAVVVGLFAGHRDLRLSQPRFLTDWLLSRGYDPIEFLLGVGAATCAGCALILLKNQRLSRTLAVLAFLSLLGIIIFGASSGYSRGPRGMRVERDSESEKNSAKAPHVVAAVTELDDRDDADASIYFRAVAMSRLDGANFVRADRCDLRLIPSLSDVSAIPRSGKDLVIAADVNHVLHFRMFGCDGVMVVDTNEQKLLASKGREIANFRGQFQKLSLPHELTTGEHFAVLTAVTSLIGHDAPHDPCIDQDVSVGFTQTHDEVPLPSVTVPGQKIIPQRISLAEDLEHPVGIISVQALDQEENADPKNYWRTYRATSRVWEVSPLGGGAALLSFARLKAGDPAWPQAVREHYLAMPGDSRYEKLARKILADLDEERLKPEFRGSALLRAFVLMRWLEENRVHTFNPAPAVDQTAAFLFDNQPGKCVQVAGAMALMLRSVGIPARAAGGYVCPTARKGKGADLLLLDSDAHAWCEIYLDGAGWFAVDPAMRSIDPPVPVPDPVLTKKLTEKHHLDELKAVAQIQAEQADGSGRWAIAFVLTWLATLYAIKLWRLVSPRVAPKAWLYRTCYRAVLDRLAEVGLSRRFGETRAEFAQRLAARVPEFAPLSAAHERHFLGGGNANERQRWLEMQSRVARSIQTNYPRPRRFVGALNPVSWLWVR
jgi:hypothetical protein